MYGKFTSDKTVHVHIKVQVQVQAAHFQKAPGGRGEVRRQIARVLAEKRQQDEILYVRMTKRFDHLQEKFKQTEQEVYTDPLTRVGNRSSTDRAIKRAIMEPGGVTIDNRAVSYLKTYAPPTIGSDIRAQQQSAGQRFFVGPYFYRSNLPAIAGETYALRSVVYESSDVLLVRSRFNSRTSRE